MGVNWVRSWHCLDLDCLRVLGRKQDCYMQLLETMVESEIEMVNVSNLTDLVLLLPKLSKNPRKFGWAWRKIGGVLAAVEQEMRLEVLAVVVET